MIEDTGNARCNTGVRSAEGATDIPSKLCMCVGGSKAHNKKEHPLLSNGCNTYNKHKQGRRICLEDLATTYSPAP